MIDLKEQGFRYFDSGNLRPSGAFAPFLARYLSDEHRRLALRPLPEPGGWRLLPAPDGGVPQQTNRYDCGVFTCFFADCLSAGRPFAFDQGDMPDLRLRLAARLLTASCEWDPP